MSKLLESYFKEEEDFYDDYDDENEEIILSQQKSETETEESFLSFATTQKHKMESKPRLKKSKNQKNLVIQFENKTEENKTEGKTILEKVHFTFDVTQCLQTSFLATGFNSISQVSTNPEFHTYFDETHRWARPEKKEKLLSKNEITVDEVKGEKIAQLVFTPLKNLSCLRRQFHAQCSVGSWIVIHGGINNEGHLLNEVVLIDSLNLNVFVMENNLERRYDPTGAINHNTLPKLYHHQMIGYQGKDAIIVGKSENNKELQLYYISNVTDVYKFQVGALKSRYGNPQHQPLKNLNSTRYVPNRKDFSAVIRENEIYIFGGISDKGMEHNDMYEISLAHSNQHWHGSIVFNGYYVARISQEDENWPKERSGHATSMFYEEMFIFGGKREGKYLNDLFAYSFTTKKWKEIQTNVCPPPLYYPTFNIISTNVGVLYGGLSSDKTVSNGIYSFDISANKWKILDIISRTDPILGDLQIPLYGHQTSLISPNLHIIGGSDGENVLDNAISINNIYESGTSEMLHFYLTEKKKEKYMCDVKLIMKDKSSTLRELDIHKFFVAGRSAYFRKLFYETNEKEIELFDYKYELVDIYINFLYSGNLIIDDQDLIGEFLGFAKIIDYEKYLLFSNICTLGRINFNVTNEIFESFVEDFTNLLEDKENSDLKILLDDGTKIHAHKLILCRSPYFRNMFGSGMIESVSDEIPLEGIENSIFQEIFKFLYLDKIEITNENCIGILISSLMLELHILSTKCRSVVEENLNAKIACQLASISDIYGDMVLKRICLKYLRHHYEVAKFLNEFDELDEETKSEIQKSHEKIKRSEEKKVKRKFLKSHKNY